MSELKILEPDSQYSHIDINYRTEQNQQNQQNHVPSPDTQNDVTNFNPNPNPNQPIIKAEHYTNTCVYVINYMFLIGALCYNNYNNITLKNISVGYIIGYIIYI